MTKRISVNPNTGHVTVNGPHRKPKPNPAQGCFTLLLLALACSGTIWAIVKIWESILSTF